jgi:hypothetical protein
MSPILLLILCTLAGPASAAGTADAPATHDNEFWRGIIAADYAVPEGESAVALLQELSALLGSTDPEVRDEFGYGIAARWIYFQRLLSPEELRELLAEWKANLRVGIGESGTESVLLRSFSALDLSILAALDNQEPYLEAQEFRELLDAALAYLADEQDVRGYVEGTGWHHSAAHTADLLKFLGRSRHLKGKDQARILDAIAAKMDAPSGIVYRYGEDERLARAVLSLLHREDLDPAGFERWLKKLGSSAEGLWEGALDNRHHATVQNTKNLLRSLYVLLSLEKEPTEPIREARAQVLDTLAGF